MDWIHCNICFRQPSKEKTFSLTSCGHMYCADCLGNGTENGICKVCKTGCSSIQLVPDMKSDVKEFFAEPDEILTKLMHVLDFQKQHRMKLTTHWISLNRKYHSAKTEVKRLQSITEKMYGNLKELHKENKALKSALNDRKHSPFNNPLPMVPLNCSSARSQMSIPQNTPIRFNQDFKSNLVTPLRVSKQRYPSNNYSNRKFPLTNGIGSAQSNGRVSTFLTPPLDTPGSKTWVRSCDPTRPIRLQSERYYQYRPGVRPPFRIETLLENGFSRVW